MKLMSWSRHRIVLNQTFVEVLSSMRKDFGSKVAYELWNSVENDLHGYKDMKERDCRKEAVVGIFCSLL